MKKQILWAGGLLLALATGYLLGAAPWRAQPAAEQQAQVRIYDQNVEWFDGVTWQRVAAVKDLQESDPFRQVQVAADGVSGLEISRPIGSVPENSGSDAPDEGPASSPSGDAGNKPSKPSANTHTSKPNTGASKPASTQKPSPSSAPAETPKPTPKPTPTPTEKPKPTPKPGGDGEDVEWSDDFL